MAGLSAADASLVIVCLLLLVAIVPDACVVVFGLVAGIAALATYKIRRFPRFFGTESSSPKKSGGLYKVPLSNKANVLRDSSKLDMAPLSPKVNEACPGEPISSGGLSVGTCSMPEEATAIASHGHFLEATVPQQLSASTITDLIEEKVNVQWLSGRCSEFQLEQGASIRQAREHAGIDRGVPSRRILLMDGSSILTDEMLLQDVAPASVLQGVVVDGWRAVTASYDYTLRVWDLLVGTCLGVLEGHTDRVSALSCDHGRQRAVSGSWDSTIRVWDLDLLTCSGVLEGHGGTVSALVADFAQEIVLSGSWDGTLCLWHVGRFELLATLGNSLGRIVSIDVDFHGGRALSRSGDGVMTVWNLKSREDIATLDGHAGWLTASTCDLTAHQAITGAFDGSLRLWDIEKAVREAVPKVVLPGGAAFALTGTAPQCWAGIVKKPHPAASPLGGLNGHDGAVNAIVADFSDSVMRAVTGGADGLRVWDLVSKTCLVALVGLQDGVQALAVDFQGERAICGVRGGSIKVWDLSAAAAEAAMAKAASAEAAEAAAMTAASASSSSELTSASLSALGEDWCSGSRAPTDAASGLESDTGISESAWGTDHGWSTATDTDAGSTFRHRARRGGQRGGLGRRTRRERGTRAWTGAAVLGENDGDAPSLLLREISSIVPDFSHSRVLTCTSDGTLQTWEVPKDYRGNNAVPAAEPELLDAAVRVTATLEGHQRSVALISCE